MGIETALILGFSALQAQQGLKQSKDQAERIIDKANIETAQKGKQVRAKGAAARSSFLTSGFELEGTPMSAIDSIFKTGLEDIQTISSSANRQAKNTIREGRMNALTTMAGAFAGADFGSGSLFGKAATSGASGVGQGLNSMGFTGAADKIGFGMNASGFGTDAYSYFDKIDGY